MNSMRLIIFLALLVFNLSGYGQSKHEIKTGLGLADRHYSLYYERLLTENFGIEASGHISFKETSFFFDDSLAFQSIDYSITRMHLGITGKYYLFFNKRYANGLFVGPYVGLDSILSNDPDLIDKLEAEGNLTERDMTNGPKELALAVNFGYKWIIKSHFIIELNIIYGRYFMVGTGAVNVFTSIDGQTNLKLGYRF